MKFKMVCDISGRMRIRCGKYQISEDMVLAVEQYFLSLPYVTRTSASQYNGSVLFLYDPNYRTVLIEAARSLKLTSLTPIKPDGQQAALIRSKQEFWDQIFWKTTRKITFRMLLPGGVRKWLTLLHALHYLRRGFAYLRKGKLTVEVLDAAAIGSAIIQGSHDSASSIMFLLSASELVQDYTMKRAKSMLSLSLLLKSETVWVMREGAEISIPGSQIALGDLVVVRAGTMIPIDGTVSSGEAIVNQSAMTGEPLGILKKEGATVFAGTVVEEGSITIEVKALQNQTRISQIVDLISESEDLKAGVQGKAERIADRIVPLSFLLSLGVYAVTGNMTKAASVLMVDYSCAIKLATPIAIISAMREATEKGILIKGGRFLETLAEADTVIFDKTGTLTNACPKVSKVVPYGGISRNEVLRLAACIEEHFPHSIARAIVEQAKEEGLEHSEQHTEVNYVVAHGISTTIHGKKALIGSHHFIFEDEGIPITADEQLALEKEIESDSAIYLAVDGQLAGFICISDPPRDDAAETIAALRRSGITRIMMLTGDAESAAARVSSELGIDHYKAQVLPEDKAAVVEELKREGRRVIMVGDGINDTPALAAADVSVSLKESSDIAQQVADITLLNSNLNDLLIARELAQQLMKRIQSNFNGIISFNSLLLILGLTDVITASTSALLHNLSTIGISAASMRPYLETADEQFQPTPEIG